MQILLIGLLTFISLTTLAKPRVIATTADVYAVVKAIAGDDVELDTIAKGTQDPHFIETKPSYMVKLSRADVVVANGLALESGWLPSLIRGARNPKLTKEGGLIELGKFIQPLDVQTGGVSRAQGDVHPDGNPHFTLDPIRLAEIAPRLAEKLSALIPDQKEKLQERAQAFAKDLQAKTQSWQKRIDKLSNKKLVTYHNSLAYFCNRFGLSVVTVLEPKPGIPPSATHILNVIETMKREKVRAILVDNFFDPKIAERVAKDVPNSSVNVVGIAVGSTPKLASVQDVTEQLISVLEQANK